MSYVFNNPYFGFMAYDEYEDMMSAYGEDDFVRHQKLTPEEMLVVRAVEVAKKTIPVGDNFMQHISMSDAGMVEHAVREAVKFVITELGVQNESD